MDDQNRLDLADCIDRLNRKHHEIAVLELLGAIGPLTARSLRQAGACPVMKTSKVAALHKPRVQFVYTQAQPKPKTPTKNPAPKPVLVLPGMIFHLTKRIATLPCSKRINPCYSCELP
jgi:hypothetical protein